MSSLCASAYVSVICTLFTQLPVVDVRLYKGGAAEIFRFDLLIVPKSDPSVSKVVQLLVLLFSLSSMVENPIHSF